MLGYLVFKTHCFLRTQAIRMSYNLKKSKFHPEEAILVFGAPRSGTTWLAEVLSAPTGSTLILEPLKLAHLQHLGYTENPYIQPTAKDKTTYEYFYKIFSGKIADGYNTYYTHLLKVLNTKQWVIKFIKANRLLPWILENFHFTQKPVFIIRHPCGVVYSQMKHPFVSKPLTIPEDDLKALKVIFGEIPEVVKKIKTRAGIKALTWVIDNYIPLHYWKPENLIVVPYERLVLDGGKELKRIYSEWGMNVPQEALLHLRKRSKEARGWSEFDRRGRKKLGTWKKHLSSDEIEEILSIVHSFGFEEFSEEIEPEYEMLLQHLIHSTKYVIDAGSK